MLCLAQAPPEMDSIGIVEWSAFVERGFLTPHKKNGEWETGAVWKIHRIHIPEIPSLPRLQLENFEDKAFSRKTLSRIKQKLEEEMLGNGFVFSSLSLDYRRFDSNSVDLYIDINTGSQYKLGKPIFEGSKTKDKVLEKLSLLQTGQDFNFYKAKKAAEKLNRSHYFQNAEMTGLLRDSTKNVLYPKYTLVDNKANQLSGLFGYNSESEGNTRPFSGFAQIHLVNLWGTARDFDFDFSIQNRETQVLAKYVEPFILGLPLGLGFEFKVLIEDSLYDENTATVSLFQDINYYSKYSVSLGTQSTQTYFSVGDSLTSISSSAKLTALELIYDWRDKALYTRKGGFSKLKLQGIARESQDSTQYLAQTQLYLQHWWSLGKHWLFKSHWENALVLPLKTGINNRGNLFKTGGANSIRGYRDNEFLTNAYSFLNLEWHYLLSQRNSFLFFMDPGFINRLTDDFYWKKVIGYGVGMNLGSRDWIFGFRFGLNPNRGFSEGMIHARLENRF